MYRANTASLWSFAEDDYAWFDMYRANAASLWSFAEDDYAWLLLNYYYITLAFFGIESCIPIGCWLYINVGIDPKPIW